MLFSPLDWAILVFTLFAVLPGALASPAPKRTKRHATTRVTVESYPAIIGGDDDEEISIPTQLTSDDSVVKLPAKAAPGRKTVASLGASAPRNVPLASRQSIEPAEKFESVPSEKRDQILKRLHLCETLFMETGRAYDYRMMTTQQLEGELVAARRAQAQSAVAPAAASEADLNEKDPILNPDL